MDTDLVRSQGSRFGFKLVVIARAWRRELDRALLDYGLSEATWRPLLHLAQLGDGVRQNELAASLGIEGPSLVRLLDMLQASGLIERREDEADRRAKTIHITESGHELTRTIAGVAAEVQGRILAGASEEDIASCLRVFERMECNIAESGELIEGRGEAKRPRSAEPADNSEPARSKAPRPES